MGTGAGSIAEAINDALSTSNAPLLAVVKSELVRACGAGLVSYAPRKWSPERKQWMPARLYRGTQGAGRGDESQETKPAAAPIVNDERRAFEAAREVDQRAAVARELDHLRAVRLSAIMSGASERVAMAPLGEGKRSRSRAVIDRGGVAAEDEARQCQVCRMQKIEMDGAALAHAAATLGERFARRWLSKKSIAIGRNFEPSTRDEVVSIYRAASIAAVMAGHANGLLGCRAALKSAAREAYSEIYKAGGRDGRDVSDGFAAVADWETRDEWQSQGSMPCGRSSAPDKSAGAGLRPSVVGELAQWGEQVREACQAKITAAATPAGKGKAIAAAARRVDLVRGLFDFIQGGNGLEPELIAEFFDGRPENGLSKKGQKRIESIRGIFA